MILLAAVLAALALVIAFPRILWRDEAGMLRPAAPQSEQEVRKLFERQLEENERK